MVRASRDLLELAIEDIDLSLLQILQKELLSDNRVLFAAYRRPHPLEKKYFLVVRVKEGDPRGVLINAINSAREKISRVSKVIDEKLGVS